MMDWIRFANPLKSNAVGRTWMSPSGRRTVEQEGERGGVLYYGINTEGSSTLQILPASELEEEIARDEANTRTRAVAQETSREAVKVEKERARWRGFTDSMTPRWKVRADQVLSRQVSVRRVFDSRGSHIETLVGEGFRIRQHPKLGRILESTSGSFFTEKDLTKIGLDYAAFLVE